MRKYRLSDEAKDDLRRIYIYGFNEFGEQQADQYYLNFFTMFKKIAANPYSYQSVDYLRLGYRRAICGSDTIYFKVNETHVDIMAILGGQDIDQWL